MTLTAMHPQVDRRAIRFAALHELAKLIAGSVHPPVQNLVNAAQRACVRGDADERSVLLVAAHFLAKGESQQCIDLLLHRAEPSLPNRQQSPLAGWRDRLTGLAWAELDAVEQAVVSLSRAITANPHWVDCWFELGQIYEARRDFRMAIAHLRRGALLETTTHQCAITLSQLLMRQHQPHRAIQVLRQALTRDRRDPGLHLELALILRRRSRYLKRRHHSLASETVLKGAKECLEIVAAGRPTAGVYLLLAGCQHRLEDFESAERSLRLALDRSPRNIAARLQLANIDIEAGRIDDAVTSYESILNEKPQCAAAHFRYSRSKRFKASSGGLDYANQLERLLHDGLSIREQVHLHFAAAKVWEDLGEYARAWQHFDKANRLKPGHSESGKNVAHTQRLNDHYQQLADRSIQYFRPERFSQGVFAQQGLAPRVRPVFIVGMPRSGTTLTEQILTSHAMVDGAGELKEIERIRCELLFKWSDDQRQSRSSRIWFERLEPLYPGLLSRLAVSDVQAMRERYQRVLESRRKDGQYVTDKMPTNFLYLGFIALLFPEAIIVHCDRNPMDIVLSCYSQNLAAPFCDLRCITKYIQMYQRLMNHWKRVLPMNVYTIQYERLVQNPEPEVRELLTACGLPWDANCLKHTQNNRLVRTPSKWQVRQPLYGSSVEKWRHYESQLSWVAEQLGCGPIGSGNPLPTLSRAQ